MKPRLAVILATYNGERYLAEQLQSILDQTRPPDEIIVTDDGSSDATMEIAETFAHRSRRAAIRLVAGPRTGLADNFLQGLAWTECDLVAWSDQDDIWHPAKLSISRHALDAHAAEFVSHSATVVHGVHAAPSSNRCPDYRRTRVNRPLHGDPWHVPSGFASVFRRRLLDGIDVSTRPVSHQTLRPMNHDHLVSLTAFASARRIELADSLASYRQHDNNVAGDPTARGVAAIREAMQTRAEDYAILADITLGYADFVGSLPRAVPGAEALFVRCAERIRRRSELYRAASPIERARRLTDGLAHRDYGRRTNGHLSALAFARDTVHVVAG